MVLAALGEDLLEPVDRPPEPILLRVDASPVVPPGLEVDDRIHQVEGSEGV